MFHFPADQNIILITSTLLLASSAVFFRLKRENYCISTLVLGALCLGLFMARLNPYLNLWDEQYHALVAKNMLTNIFKPVLYSDPLLDYDYKNWTGNYIWLHKQPLFLWQMAISLKIFGVNEISVRIPSIIMHAIVPVFIYRIGKRGLGRNIGFYAAIFFTAAYYPLELAAGTYGTDHNDTAFLFYVTASLWAWFEYKSSQNKYWLILIGLFSGCAVLVKWLVGLLVYAVWVLTKTVNYREQLLRLKSYTPIFISLTISAVVILPWQIYILNKYPLEANQEYALNTKHFFEVVENHAGNLWFHIDSLGLLYGSGDLVPVLILLGLILMSKSGIDPAYRIALVSPVLIIYLFYSIASTKIPSFGVVVAPFIFLGLASLVDFVFNFFNERFKFRKFNTTLASVVLFIIAFSLFDLNKIKNVHTIQSADNNRNRPAELLQMNLIRKINMLPVKNYVIFNSGIRLNGHIPTMFYTNYISYDFIPTEIQLDKIKSEGYLPVIVNVGGLPDYILQNKGLLLMEFDNQEQNLSSTQEIGKFVGSTES